jgi:hydroxymethylpyrimidine/phosphomethylpyrimidine kinase
MSTKPASKPQRTYHRVLTIAGSDSGGGAGIQADLKTFAANGCYGLSVITALTAQNTMGVSGIHPVPVEFVRQQLRAVLGDIGADAVKVGMLFSVPLIETVAAALAEFAIAPVVVDPVMVAQSGDRLLEADAIDTIKTQLLSLATVITPNLPEAQVLLGRTISGQDELYEAARDLAQFGCRAVLVKAGHLDGAASTDILYLADAKRFVTLEGERIDTRNNHGTGCTLSSAIAAGLAQGLDLEAAARSAKTYIQRALQAGSTYRIGQGHGPVHHFYAFWQ